MLQRQGHCFAFSSTSRKANNHAIKVKSRQVNHSCQKLVIFSICMPEQLNVNLKTQPIMRSRENYNVGECGGRGNKLAPMIALLSGHALQRGPLFITDELASTIQHQTKHLLYI
jgi:hypothetical protein